MIVEEAVERLSEESDVPIPASEWYMHQARYLFAAVRQTRGRDVLDIACGSGYGSALLARYGARSVTGVDLSEQALSEARRNHAHDGVAFVHGDACDPPVSGPFGAVVSFETVEHLPDPERALDAFARLLAPDGVLVVSTPNRGITNPGKTRRDPPPNPFHLVELDRGELMEALRARFGDVRLYGQAYRFPATRVHRGRVADALSWATAWPVGLPWPLAPTYLVAVCRGPR